MNELYLLDTAVASRAAHNDATLIPRLEAALKVYVPEAVFGELFYGAYRYARLHSSAKFLDLYERLAADNRYELMQADLDTARIYGAISAELEMKGTPIQPNDMWIAALARQHGLILLTRDGDFARVTGLALELL
jgi:tRNA(fMet)-specific endonuclease VapC